MQEGGNKGYGARAKEAFYSFTGSMANGVTKMTSAISAGCTTLKMNAKIKYNISRMHYGKGEDVVKTEDSEVKRDVVKNIKAEIRAFVDANGDKLGDKKEVIKSAIGADSSALEGEIKAAVEKINQGLTALEGRGTGEEGKDMDAHLKAISKAKKVLIGGVILLACAMVALSFPDMLPDMISETGIKGFAAVTALATLAVDYKITSTDVSARVSAGNITVKEGLTDLKNAINKGPAVPDPEHTL